MAEKKKHYNHLKNEKSPYLIQHAKNPVDWYPWGEEAFKKAKRENKPIFLSIGYSTCHWCHVMARESFQDPEMGDLINQVFIPIKVDREELPDVDSTYMTASQIMTGTGGWPLTVFLTPDLKPFFAGTYFPKDTTEISIGLRQIILNVKELWNNQSEEVLKNAEEISSNLKNISQTKSGDLLDEPVLKNTYKILEKSCDEYGGFGTSQKFPSPNILLYLLHYWESTGEENALEMVRKTLDHMSRGGIWDHIGYGFHRYSVDPQWLIPHFEKMLYDQALLAIVYMEAYQATGNNEYQQKTDQILKYVLRDMKSPQGGFYSAEDAESEGEEGKYYLWSKKEITKILNQETTGSPKDSEMFSLIYQIQEKGNYFDMASGGYNGMNIPHLKQPLEKTAEEMGMEVEELQQKLENMRRKLFQAREERIHPSKDDKILTDWNGLMIAALARAGRVLGRKEYTETAIKAVDFIKNNLYQEGKLMHRYRDGEVKVEGYLEDYTFMIWSLLELYQTTLDSSYLKWGLELNQILLDQFWDSEEGGFFLTSKDAADLLMRKKDASDGSLPSGNGVMFLNMLRLSSILEDQKLKEKTIELEKAFAPRVKQIPSGHTMFLMAVMDRIGPFYEVVISGEKEDEQTQKLIDKLNSNYLPRTVFSLNSSDEEWLRMKVESFREKKPLEKKSTAYVCKQGVCELPTTDENRLMELLK
ncbi:MAG: thioredoxin domain-containing protein [Methanobacterium sp.]|nr:thioredoxin domain-containing protein [Methanobacterium sp.]